MFGERPVRLGNREETPSKNPTGLGTETVDFSKIDGL